MPELVAGTASSLWFYRQPPHARDKNGQWFRDMYEAEDELCESCSMFPSDRRAIRLDTELCRMFDRDATEFDLCFVCGRYELNQTIRQFIEDVEDGEVHLTARIVAFVDRLLVVMQDFDEEFAIHFKPTKQHRRRTKTRVAADERLFKYQSYIRITATILKIYFNGYYHKRKIITLLLNLQWTMIVEFVAYFICQQICVIILLEMAKCSDHFVIATTKLLILFHFHIDHTDFEIELRNLEHTMRGFKRMLG